MKGQRGFVLMAKNSRRPVLESTESNAPDGKTTIARVLGIVEQQGALGAGSLSTREERAGPWWDWSDEKHALEWLFAAGQVTVAGRRGFERLYDLPERVIPARSFSVPTPSAVALCSSKPRCASASSKGGCWRMSAGITRSGRS